MKWCVREGWKKGWAGNGLGYHGGMHSCADLFVCPFCLFTRSPLDVPGLSFARFHLFEGLLFALLYTCSHIHTLTSPSLRTVGRAYTRRSRTQAARQRECKPVCSLLSQNCLFLLFSPPLSLFNVKQITQVERYSHRLSHKLLFPTRILSETDQG